MKKLLIAMLVLTILMIAGCTSEPSKPAPAEKPQPKAADLETGRYAFQKLYIAARGWQRDAQPFIWWFDREQMHNQLAHFFDDEASP